MTAQKNPALHTGFHIKAKTNGIKWSEVCEKATSLQVYPLKITFTRSHVSGFAKHCDNNKTVSHFCLWRALEIECLLITKKVRKDRTSSKPSVLPSIWPGAFPAVTFMATKKSITHVRKLSISVEILCHCIFRETSLPSTFLWRFEH